MGAYSNKEGVYWDTQSLAEDVDGSAIEVRNNSAGAFWLVWSGAAATDAVVKAQESGDGTNWLDISGKSVTIAAATGKGVIKLTAAELLLPYLRLSIVDNTESAGSITVRHFFKGDR